MAPELRLHSRAGGYTTTGRDRTQIFPTRSEILYTIRDTLNNKLYVIHKKKNTTHRYLPNTFILPFFTQTYTTHTELPYLSEISNTIKI